MGSRMTYYIKNHQHKGRAFRNALRSSGWQATKNNPDLALYDRDWYLHNDGLPRKSLVEHHEQGAKIVVYPHSALPPWWYDGLIHVDKRVSAIIVIGENGAEATRIFCPDKTVLSVGWPWSRTMKFQPCKEIRNVLFAPIHPSGGRLRPEAYQANRDVLRALLKLPRGISINIRHIGRLEAQGLWRDSRIDYSAGKPDGRHHHIDRADLVIAEGTFMYLSVARGKPTIGINQHLPLRANKQCKKYEPHNWSDYSHLFEYPINFGDAPLPELMKYAGENEQVEWRKLNVGDPMCYTKFEAEMRAIIHE